MNLTRVRRTGIAAVALGFALTLSACSSDSSSTDNPSPVETAAEGSGPIAIGAFNFGESRILANIYSQVLQAAGFEPTIKELTNREVVEPALESGDVQVVPEYLGTLTEFLNVKANGPDAKALASGDVDATLAEAQKLANAVGITLLVPSPAADQNAFAVTREFSEKNGITSLSDLAEYSKTNKVTLGGPAECPTRPFCQPGLENIYKLKVGDFVSLDAGGPLTKTALGQGKIDVGLIFSSDGGVAANDFVVLQDDKSLQTVDNIVAAVNTAALTPALEKTLNDVNAALTTDELVALNKSVDIDRGDPATVAEQWLKSKGLVS